MEPVRTRRVVLRNVEAGIMVDWGWWVFMAGEGRWVKGILFEVRVVMGELASETGGSTEGLSRSRWRRKGFSKKGSFIIKRSAKSFTYSISP